MSMLAEPRRKQKFSENPRGLAWSKDENKFGQKLMESMGWKAGKGLGAKEDGETQHVKISLKSDNRGVGCTKKHSDKWLAHQDDFSALLQSLNAGEAPAAAGSDTELLQMEARSKKQKGYRKFSRGKDLSSRSKHEMDCVFGKRSAKSEGNTPQLPRSKADSGSEKDEDEALHGVKTITSSQNVQQYFAEKMAALKRTREGKNASVDAPKQGGGEDSGSEVESERTEEEERKGAVVQWSYGDDVDAEVVESPGDSEGIEEGERRKDEIKKENVDDVEKGQKKRSKKRKADDGDETSDSTGSGEDTKKKKSKRSKREVLEEVEEDLPENSPSQDQEGERTTKKKKSKKSKSDRAISDDGEMEAAETTDKKKKKKKKRKVREEEVCEDVCDEPAKKKKRKKKNRSEVCE